MKPTIIVTGLPRSGTSMMMRCLEMGGIPCVYNESPIINSSMKNPYGFFENGVIPPEGGVAAKRLGKKVIEKLKTLNDCYFIFMNREPGSIVQSWIDVSVKNGVNSPTISFEDRITNTTNQQSLILNTIKDQKYIKVDFESMFSDSIGTLTKIKDFLPVPFDVDEAVKAIDSTLYVDRTNTPAPVTIELTDEQKAKVAKIQAELDAAKRQRAETVAPIDDIIIDIRARLEEARTPITNPTPETKPTE